jgi:protein TonB
LLPSREEIVHQFQADVPAIDGIRFPASRPNGVPAAAAITEFHEILLPSLQADAVEIAKPARKKWPIIAGASAAVVVILAAAMIFVFNRGRAPSAKPVAAPSPAIATIQRPEDVAPAPTRDPSTPIVPASPPAATRLRRGGESVQEPARQPVQKDAEPSQEQIQRMVDQLHTPTRLHMKTAVAEQTPAPRGGFSAADMSGSDNSNVIGAAFGSPKQPKVQMASQQLVILPSGVASNLVIQKTLPVYPSIAKAGQVSGTIVLAATISKTGSVDDLHVVSGPYMLRISALNAVRTWRFKPYILYNQPTAFETTIYVHFCGQQDPCVQGRE